IFLLVVEYFLTQSFPIERSALQIIAVFSVIWSSFFFVIVVLAIPFLTSEGFRPSPIRLFSDALISILLSIVSFAVGYRYWGIVPPEGEIVARFDYYYFSAVTFSTLGFGDFRPSADARFLASFQAILGNLHLGIIVGAAFFAAQPVTSGGGANDDSGNDDRNGQ
ncbi:MAG: ion channel, partial [Lentilitoribacter sp.]